MLEVSQGALGGPPTHFTVLGNPADCRPSRVLELVVPVSEEHEDEFVRVVPGLYFHRPVQRADAHWHLRFDARREHAREQYGRIPRLSNAARVNTTRHSWQMSRL